MFRHQTTQLAGIRANAPLGVGGDGLDPAIREYVDSQFSSLVGQINQSYAQQMRVLTSCGARELDTDGFEFKVYGESGPNAGKADSRTTTTPNSPGDHGTLRVTQLNPNAGKTSNPNLFAAIFEGPVKFTHLPWGAVRLATATANWNNVVHPGDCTVAATDDETGDAVTIQLYRPGPAVDPNVRTGYQVAYAYDADGFPTAVSGYLDCKIGMIKVWSGAIGDIPAGWQLCNGTNGTPDLRDRFLVGAGSTYAVGATGGATTHTHIGTTDGTVLTTDTDGAHTHMGLTDADGNHSHGGATGTGSISSSGAHTHAAGTASGTTDNNTTGVTINDHAAHNHELAASLGAPPAFDTDTADSVYTVNNADLSSHVVNDLGHNHNFSDITVTIGTDGAHTHSVPALSISPSGTHTHSFTTSSHAGHTHTVASHTHTFTTGSGSSLPPYYGLAIIQRVD